jgi:hypothetical protein
MRVLLLEAKKQRLAVFTGSVNTYNIQIVYIGGLNGIGALPATGSPAMPTVTHLFYFAALVTTAILLGIVTRAKVSAGVK